MRPEPRIAFVTDALPAIGGAEKTLFAALECFPRADVFTLVYNREAFAGSPLSSRKVFRSYLDRVPALRKHYRLLLPLMPHAIEQFDLGNYDIVVSFHYAVANGANAKQAKHLSYTHTPMRYAWENLNIHGKKPGNNILVDQYFRSFRRWDSAAASRISGFATISRGIAGKIRSAYERDARLIYPPVETERYHACEARDPYYVVVSRLVAHKRIDLIVDAFSALGLPLKIIGEGPEKQALMGRAAGNIEFLGFQSDACVADVLSRARAFVCSAEEDFGIAVVEAQAAGCPVIAYGRSGVLETVVEGRTGLFFAQQTVDCLIEVIRAYDRQMSAFDIRAIIDNARRFDKAVFKADFRQFVEED